MANDMKYSYCPDCGNTEIKEHKIRDAIYGYNSIDTNEPGLLQPAVIKIYCPDCFWKEEYNEDNSDPV